MKQEDKELLLKDLCARLPYGVKTYTNVPHLGGCGEIIERTLDSITIDKNSSICLSLFPDEIPYLRPMSSMTKEERKEWLSLMRKEYREQYPHSAVDTSYYEYFPTIESFDYLNSHHFDYRGLIEKGLALEAPEGMYQ